MSVKLVVPVSTGTFDEWERSDTSVSTIENINTPGGTRFIYENVRYHRVTFRFGKVVDDNSHIGSIGFNIATRGDVGHDPAVDNIFRNQAGTTLYSGYWQSGASGAITAVRRTWTRSVFDTAREWTPNEVNTCEFGMRQAGPSNNSETRYVYSFALSVYASNGTLETDGEDYIGWPQPPTTESNYGCNTTASFLSLKTLAQRSLDANEAWVGFWGKPTTSSAVKVAIYDSSGSLLDHSVGTIDISSLVCRRVASTPIWWAKFDLQDTVTAPADSQIYLAWMTQSAPNVIYGTVDFASNNFFSGAFNYSDFPPSSVPGGLTGAKRCPAFVITSSNRPLRTHNIVGVAEVKTKAAMVNTAILNVAWRSPMYVRTPLLGMQVEVVPTAEVTGPAWIPPLFFV